MNILIVMHFLMNPIPPMPYLKSQTPGESKLLLLELLVLVATLLMVPMLFADTLLWFSR